MSEKNKVSVIIPCYNAEKYIESCLLSLIEQDYKNLEIIVIDDGSRDHTGDLVKKFVEFDPRIKLIQTINRGVSSARNTGIDTATGNYITFIDSDDYIEKDCYKTIVERMKEKNADIAIYAFCRDHQDFKEITALPWENNTILDHSKIINELIPFMIAREDGKSTVSGSVCRSVFKKNIVESIRFKENISIQEDLIFCLYTYFKATRIMILNDVYYHYVKHTDTTTERYRKNYYHEAMNYEKEIYQFLEKSSMLDNNYNRYCSKKIGTYSLCLSNLFRADAPSSIDDELSEIIKGFKSDKTFKKKYSTQYLSKKKILAAILLKIRSKTLIKTIYRNKEKIRYKKLAD